MNEHISLRGPTKHLGEITVQG